MAREKLTLEASDSMAGDTPMDEELPPDLDEETPVGMSDDDFGNMAFDNDEAERVSMEINPPPATWEKATRWEVRRSINTEDRQPGDKDEAGRTYIKVGGTVEPKTIEGQVYQPKVEVSLSPDKRADKKDPSKFDLAYVLYVKSWEIFVADKGRKPQTYGEYATYLRDGNYFIRTFKGNNGPFPNELISKVDMKKRSR